MGLGRAEITDLLVLNRPKGPEGYKEGQPYGTNNRRR
jgi:hypothetical protein